MLERSGAYHPLGSQGDPARGESLSMNNASQIQELRLQVERCIDADLLLLEDGQRLLAVLDDALAALTASAAFVDQPRASIAAGAPPTGDEPPLAAAAVLVAVLARAGDTVG
jgi:hypothetical protein